MKTITMHTPREGLIDITAQVHDYVLESAHASGLCLVYCPHTTAGITINENADPDVRHDVMLALNRLYPDMPDFRHTEGNSAAHLKAIAVGCSVTIPFHRGKLMLGTWQGIYFAEFDGPRTRSFIVQLM